MSGEAALSAGRCSCEKTMKAESGCLGALGSRETRFLRLPPGSSAEPGPEAARSAAAASGVVGSIDLRLGAIVSGCGWAGALLLAELLLLGWR
jgi:hypothetical protein